MTNCTGLKEGDTVNCSECGLELTVSKNCECGDDDNVCVENTFTCCGHNMEKK